MTTITPLPPRPASTSPDRAPGAGSSPDSGFGELVAANLEVYSTTTQPSAPRPPRAQADGLPPSDQGDPAAQSAGSATPGEAATATEDTAAQAKPGATPTSQGTAPAGATATTGALISTAEAARQRPPTQAPARGAPSDGTSATSAGTGAANANGGPVAAGTGRGAMAGGHVPAKATTASGPNVDARVGRGPADLSPGSAATSTTIAGTPGAATSGVAAPGGAAGQSPTAANATAVLGPGQPTATTSATLLAPVATASSARGAHQAGSAHPSPAESPTTPSTTAALGPTTQTTSPALSTQLPAAQVPATTAVVPQVMGEVSALLARGDGTHRIRLTLRPASLGDVSVILTVRGGAVEVTLGASGTGRAALEQSTAELHRLLELTGARSTQVLVKDLASPSAAAFLPSTTSGPDHGQHGPGHGQPQHPGPQNAARGSVRQPVTDPDQALPSTTPPARPDKHRTSLDVSI